MGQNRKPHRVRIRHQESASALESCALTSGDKHVSRDYLAEFRKMVFERNIKRIERRSAYPEIDFNSQLGPAQTDDPAFRQESGPIRLARPAGAYSAASETGSAARRPAL